MTKTKALTRLEHAHIGLKILELLEPVHSNDAKLSILEAAQLMCKAAQLMCNASDASEADALDVDDECPTCGEQKDVDDDECRACSYVPPEVEDECDLCDQEAELEAGSFTPHGHGGR